ncbi:hypothetical protein Tsubulata_010566 [Turnera subulata]|uniref:DUF4283 domain-containing protein n=1 Tax=Turnera subulata TaxID=218843 RepID=A0A9Q0FS38_9ROSI|nr:hypothetical protein Tsubulata_010566 [Turnera subulata]
MTEASVGEEADRSMKKVRIREQDLSTTIPDTEMLVDGSSAGTKEGTHGLSLSFSADYKRRLEKAWKHAVIVKLLGKSFGYETLCARLQSLWKPAGAVRVIDLDNEFYAVRFEKEDDYIHALADGPWIIMNYVLTVQPWVTFFRASKGQGKFARVAVEVDLQKPLKGMVEVEDEEFLVMYEGLPTMCYEYGSTFHSLASCPARIAHEKVVAASFVGSVSSGLVAPKSSASNPNPKSMGEWMNAPRNSQRRAWKEPTQGGINSDKGGSGSRFLILTDVLDGESMVPQGQTITEASFNDPNFILVVNVSGGKRLPDPHPPDLNIVTRVGKDQGTKVSLVLPLKKPPLKVASSKKKTPPGLKEGLEQTKLMDSMQVPHHTSEPSEGTTVTTRRDCRRFQAFLDASHLSDLGFHGPQFTWRRGLVWERVSSGDVFWVEWWWLEAFSLSGCVAEPPPFPSSSFFFTTTETATTTATLNHWTTFLLLPSVLLSSAVTPSFHRCNRRRHESPPLLQIATPPHLQPPTHLSLLPHQSLPWRSRAQSCRPPPPPPSRRAARDHLLQCRCRRTITTASRHLTLATATDVTVAVGLHCCPRSASGSLLVVTHRV